MDSFGMRRLDFRLHDFTRRSWASDHARAVWEPRIERIAACWQEIEWRSVAAGQRTCAVSIVPADALAPLAERMREHDLAVLPLDTIRALQSTYMTTHVTAKPGEPWNYRVVIASAANADTFKTAWDSGHQRAVSSLLGYPDCCGAFFEDVWVKEHFVDTTWPMTCRTNAKKLLDPHTYEIQGPPYANILLRWLGVRAVPHLPCRFDCMATVELAQQLLALGQSAGYAAEMDWILAMLQWPVEWSALHGIAEIKTPVVKIATVSDATADKHVVRRPGDTYPEEGAQGLVFPYRTPIHLRMTESRGFKRGLANPIRRYDEATGVE